MGAEKGYLALVLHAHLPFIKHPEYPDFLEEDWFYEAMVETYLPLLNVFENLQAEGTDFRLTMSLTPPLCNMMSDPLLIERFRHYLNQRIELSSKEIERTRNTAFEAVAKMYYDKFRRYQDLFENRYHGHILEGFKKFQDLGKLEIITCCATHGYLPLMVHKESVNAQIKTAVTDYRSRFGRSPRGIWLAECAYNPGDDKFLREEGIRERSMVQSSYITEWLFMTHDDVKRRVYECLLETSKAALEGRTKKFQYILSDGSLKVMEIDGDEFAESDYGLVVDSSNGIQELNSKLDTLAQAALQNQALTFSTIMKLFGSSSLAEKQRLVEKDERNLQERQAQAQQQQLQVQQQEIEQKAQLEQAKLQQEDALNRRDNETKILIAQMQAMSKSSEDGNSTELEYSQEAKDKLLEQIREFDLRLKLDKERLEHDKEKAETDARLKEKQINKQKATSNNNNKQ